MSTGSIRHNIEITDSADAERFVEALEKAKAESEEGMERKEIIDGLKDLIKDRFYDRQKGCLHPDHPKYNKKMGAIRN